ncbi:MAG: hypothetical protein LUC21_07835, partial [Oscillospiraceae bacterium]|nr:hypothetical protein [Oscillospiraceae bacterium]
YRQTFAESNKNRAWAASHASIFCEMSWQSTAKYHVPFLMWNRLKYAAVVRIRHDTWIWEN